MHKRTEGGKKVGNENSMVHIPASQSILELAFCEGLGYVSEKFYSLPPTPAYPKTYQQLPYLCIFFSVIPGTHSHTSTYIYNLFQFTEKIKPADWKRLHSSASRSINLPAPYLSSLIIVLEITLHLLQLPHPPQFLQNLTLSTVFSFLFFSFHSTACFPQAFKHM